MPRRNRSADSTLVLAQDATFIITVYNSASNVLTLTQDTELSLTLSEIEQTLDLTQSVSLSNPVITESATSLLTLAQFAWSQGTKYTAASNAISLTQSVYNSIKSGVASSTLALTQEASATQPKSKSASNTLSLQQTVSTAGSIINVALTSYVSLSQHAAPNIGGIYVAANHLHLSQSAKTGDRLEEASNIIYLSQSAVAVGNGVSYPAESTLELTQSVDPDIVRSLSLASTLVLVQVTSTLVFTDTTEEDSQWSDVPTLIDRATSQFTYPYVSPNQTLELRNPDFNNSELVSHNRINRKSRGGTLQIFRESTWPSAQRLKMTFSYLPNVDRVALLQFLEDSLGQEVGYLDHESRQWRGVILTPAAQVAEEKYSGCGHSASLEFQGTLV